MNNTYISICPESYGLLPVEAFLSAVSKMENDVKTCISRYGNKRLYELPQEEILTLLKNTELLDKSLRSCVKSETILHSNVKEELELWTDVHVYEHEGAILLMDFPPLVNISYRNGEYGLSKRAELSLFQWFANHSPPEFYDENRYLYIYKRYTSEPIDMVSDNDNWEMKRITNAVSQAIGYSDNPRFSEFLYTTVESEYNGAELLLTRHNSLVSFMSYLSSGTPIHPESSSFIREKQVEKNSAKISKGSLFQPSNYKETGKNHGEIDGGRCGPQKTTGIGREEELPY